jgi:ubiquinone/menaquinone biosynthesis C-methylase UbiE
MDAREIYREHADRYDELVRAEDCEGALGPALGAIVELAGQAVVEVGCGTGRLTEVLLDAGARVIATEREPAMLAVAQRRLADRPRLELRVADARQLPLPDASADIGVAGWVFGHLRHWWPDQWRDEIGRALDELARVLRPGGTTIVVETLGTGTDRAAPPNQMLAEYYAWLERERGFSRREIRTDYRFADVESAARVLGFFFGPQKAELVRAHGWARVPECTGVWWRRS